MRLLRTYLYGFAECMRLCVGCTAFAFVYVYDFAQSKRLLRTYTALRTLYGFCELSGFCVRIRLLRFQRLVCTHTYFAYLHRVGDSVITIRRLVRRSDDLILRFVDSFDVSVIHST